MVSQLLLDRTEPKASFRMARGRSNGSAKEVRAYHACLVGNYISYLSAAGYSKCQSDMHKLEMGARRFLAKFPDPNLWLGVSIEEQHLSDCKQRSFLHYLFLRRILPMPLTYLLMPRPHLYDMAMRLMERDAYQLYRKAAKRLEYRDIDITDQFRALLCLMVWSQKRFSDLTLDDLDSFTRQLRVACVDVGARQTRTRWQNGLPKRWDNRLKGVHNVLYHMGIFPQFNRNTRGLSFEQQWKDIPPSIGVTVRRYLQQVALSLRPESAYQEKLRLFRFFSWLARNHPEVTQLDQLQRCHIEAFKEYLRWVPPQHKSNRLPGDVLSPATRYHLLAALYYFLNRIAAWQWPESTTRALMFTQDFPTLDQASPKFLDEPSAAKFLQAARAHPDPFTRLCGVTLLLTGMRQGEFLGLTADCMVQIGENHWLQVPLGKMHNDRYIPLHPEVKQLLDEWKAERPPQKPYDFLFTEHGYRFGRGKVALAVERIGQAAGIKERVPPHRLRHTLATMAINRGMPLESIAALLGHRSLSMTMVYARISNRTVQQEYTQVSQHLEEICNQVKLSDGAVGVAKSVPVEGAQMRRLRQDNWRLLGNGYCTRPEGVPCEFETVCESCTCFSTTVEFLPMLNRQKQDAEEKGQAQRANILSRLIQSLEQAPVNEGQIGACGLNT